MSFRGDGQQRYGHVPPVQYPVSSQGNPYDQQGNNLARRPSFNTGDDGAYYGQPAQQNRTSTYPNQAEPDDELFLASPTSAQSGYNRSTAFGAANNALSGYQHQYQAPAAPTLQQQSTYNPQTFAQASQPYQRTQSVSYAQHPSPQYSSTASFPSQQPAYTPQSTYTPQTYNPAAYASANPPQRQPSYAGYNTNNDQSYGATSPSHVPAAFSHGQSPGAVYTASFPQPARTNTITQNYQPTMPATSPSTAMNPQTPATTYNPSQWANNQYAPAYSNGTSPGHTYSQAPYPATSQIPVGPNYSADQSTTYYTRESRSNSQVSPTGSPIANSPRSPGLQRHPTNAPLPSRPQEDSATRRNWDPPTLPVQQDFGRDQAALMQDIEEELGALGLRDQQRASTTSSKSPVNGRYPDGQGGSVRTYSSASSHTAHSNHRGSSNAPTLTSAYEEDDDDPEGTAGVLAMQQAELDDRRFSGTTFAFTDTSSVMTTHLAPPAEEQSPSSESDLGGAIDLGMLSGGYAGNLTYGDNVGSPPGSSSMQESNRPLPSPSHYAQQGYNQSPAYNNAQMDYGGTGGLQPPTAARLSFDEGDERVSLDSRQSGTESPTKDDYQDLFYHPGLTNRPLPAIPPAPASDSSSMISSNANNLVVRQHSQSLSTDSRFYQPEGLETYYNNGSPYSPQPERSISVSGHTTTPQVQAPTRSRTDAAEERKKASRHQIVTNQSATLPEYDSPSVGAFEGITLPTARKRRFVPSKLSPGDLRRCAEPWALSNIEAWIRDMADGEPDLKEKTIEEGLIHLFTSKVPTMNVADAEALSSRVVTLMLESKTLIPEEEWVKFGHGHISGVLWQMTGSGCYAPKVHDHESTGRCYSYHCNRTLKKVDLDDLDAGSTKPTDEWHIFYGLKKVDWESKPKKEVERQNILHEIVTGEENYIKQLDLFRTLYRDDLRTRKPPILQPEKQEKFLVAVFGKLDVVLRINKENLLSQLKYRQQEQGPWIVGFSDVFREWIRKARSDYIEYATAYPRAQFMVRKEADRNVLFRRFLEEKQKHRLSSKQDWTHFLITPLQRLQRYILLLESIEGKTLKESEEKTNLQKAIAEIRGVTLECDAKVEETNKRVEMMELDRMLVLRSGFQSILNLDHLGRQLLMQGELTRLGSKGVRWVDMHAMLFDHYLILAKAVTTREGKKYDVSKEPIPMPLLFLESMNDEPIQRQKGITAPLARTATASASGTQLNKVASNGSGRPTLEHVATSSTMSGSLTPSGDSEGRILFPFRVKHLGHEVYVLYANTARDRMEWCERLIAAKTNHAKALFTQNAEPFRLRVLADAAFAYDSSSVYARASSVPVKGTPLDRAITDLEGVLGAAQGIAPICRAQVNCATAFTAFGKSIIAIGTDYGVFISDPSNPRGWTRTVQASRITQIAILEDFSVCLVIADKSLISYPLDVIAPVSDFAPPINDTPRRAPQRLAKEVTYFATAKMKERMLVFYKRREGLHTTFKVLEPIYHKATEKRRIFGGKRTAPGSTESFRDFDEFFFPTECYSLSIFQTYIAVATSKGIEMLTLDKKQPMSIPDLKTPAIANIAERIRNQRPLGMFRLNENEFILTYEDCAVYVDKHGEVSRTLIMEYTGKAKKARSATMYGQYLLLFNEDYVEVRNAENGRLRQIIAGKDVRVLDYGVKGPTGTPSPAPQAQGRNGHLPSVGDASKGTVKIAMCHPELPGRQVVLEMLLNDGHMEN